MKKRPVKNLVNDQSFENFDVVDVDSTGLVRGLSFEILEVPVYGYFKYDHWWFMINQSVWATLGGEMSFTVTEMSTGGSITDAYATIDGAYQAACRILREKRSYLPTAINGLIVSLGANLLRRNLTFPTPAINSVLW